LESIEVQIDHSTPWNYLRDPADRINARLVRIDELITEQIQLEKEIRHEEAALRRK
jgi:hypothetical protein